MGLIETARFFTFPTPEMRRLAQPTQHYGSVMEIDFKLFFSEKHLITDWDGVWVPHHGLLDSAHRQKLEEAVATCASVSILSNCGKDRAMQVESDIGGLEARFYRAEPKKPHPNAFLNIFAAMELVPGQVASQVVYIGDRRFTDVYGAAMAGIHTVVMVSPLSSKDPFGVKMARLLENAVYN